MTGTLAMLPQVEIAHATDPGKDPDKQVNEDTCRYAETAFGHLAVLCDGMGGHEGGREASVAAVESVFRYVQAAALRPDLPQGVRAREVLRDAIGEANRQVFGLAAASSAARPGSTLVALLLHSMGTEIAHVGDSRCYLVHAGEIRQVTRDHSMVQQMVDAGKLTPAEAAVHPDANRITRALGMATEVAVEVQPSSVLHADGDVLVLCSDGLSDLVGALEISRAVTASPPALAAQQLIDLANSRGGFDNVTVAIVRARATALASLDGATRVALGATETMPAFHTPSTRPEAPEDVRVRGPSVAPPSNQPLLPHAPPPSHPHRVARRVARRASPAVLVGLVLALVGVAAVVAVVTLEVVPHGQRNPVPGLSLSIVLPAATLVPAGPAVDEDVDAGVDAAPRGHRFRNPKRK